MAGKTVFVTDNKIILKEVPGMPDFPLREGMRFGFQDHGSTYEVVGYKTALGGVDPILAVTVRSVVPYDGRAGLDYLF